MTSNIQRNKSRKGHKGGNRQRNGGGSVNGKGNKQYLQGGKDVLGRKEQDLIEGDGKDNNEHQGVDQGLV